MGNAIGQAIAKPGLGIDPRYLTGAFLKSPKFNLH